VRRDNDFILGIAKRLIDQAAQVGRTASVGSRHRIEARREIVRQAKAKKSHAPPYC
jgi:hypothetical protein